MPSLDFSLGISTLFTRTRVVQRLHLHLSSLLENQQILKQTSLWLT